MQRTTSVVPSSYFAEAMKKPRNSNGRYEIWFPSERIYLLGDVFDYASSNGYIIFKSEEAKTNYMKYTLNPAKMVEFIPASDVVPNKLSKISECAAMYDDFWQTAEPDYRGIYTLKVGLKDAALFDQWFVKPRTLKERTILRESSRVVSWNKAYYYKGGYPAYKEYRFYPDEDCKSFNEQYDKLLQYRGDIMLDGTRLGGNIFNSYEKIIEDNPLLQNITPEQAEKDFSELASLITCCKSYEIAPKEKKKSLIKSLPPAIRESDQFKNFICKEKCSKDPDESALDIADYLEIFGDYGLWDEQLILSKEEECFCQIAEKNRIDYYVRAFPMGKHIEEVRQWAEDKSAWEQYKITVIADMVKELKSYLEDESLLDYCGVYSHNKNYITLNKVDMDLPARFNHAKKFVMELVASPDNSAVLKMNINALKGYITVLNGLWCAYHTSFDCQPKKWFTYSILASDRNPYVLSDLGKWMNEQYQLSINTLTSSNLPLPAERKSAITSFLASNWDEFSNVANDFYKGITQSYRDKKIDNAVAGDIRTNFSDDGTICTVILKNGDKYEFYKHFNAWCFKSGLHVSTPSSMGVETVEEMIDLAGKLNKEYYQY